MQQQPSALALFATLVVLFPGAAAVGSALANAFANGSWVAMCVSFFALPLAFASGLQAWMGLALIVGLIRLVLGRRGSTPPAAAARERLPGGFIFVPFSSAAGLVAGLVTGVVSPTHGVVLVTVVYWAVGTIHGLASWYAVRAGWLVPPDHL